jgi:hypothetical protein
MINLSIPVHMFQALHFRLTLQTIRHLGDVRNLWHLRGEITAKLVQKIIAPKIGFELPTKNCLRSSWPNKLLYSQILGAVKNS